MKRRDEATLAFYQLRWERWENYRIHTDGWIYPAGIGRDWYSPSQEEGLPSELARVNQAWKRRRLGASTDLAEDIVVRSVLDFLRQFGFLGLTHLWGEPRKVALDGVTQFADGDLFAWVLAHAENVELCLSLAGSLGSGHHERLAQIWQYLEETRPQLFPGLPLRIPTLTEHLQMLNITTLYAPGSSLTKKTHALLQACLAPNLGQVGRVYDSESGRSVFQFQALIQLIYWQLADWINGERLRECRECHMYFFAHDGRQQFCPPPQGIKESRCARRFRMRARRAGQKSAP
jgi:hypothetical protein